MTANEDRAAGSADVIADAGGLLPLLMTASEVAVATRVGSSGPTSRLHRPEPHTTGEGNDDE
jgi:hypothetical protein